MANKLMKTLTIGNVTYEIVDAVARAKTVEQIQSDWNQVDETKADFIKNKPVEATDDEVMALLAAYNVITLFADATGYVYLDVDGKILVM